MIKVTDQLRNLPVAIRNRKFRCQGTRYDGEPCGSTGILAIQRAGSWHAEQAKLSRMRTPK